MRATAQTVLAFALVPLMVGCSTAATARSASYDRDGDHPVRAFFSSGVEAFNAHDLDGFVRQFGDNIEMYTPTGWLRGKPAVRERFTQTFAQFPKVRMVVEDLRVREIAPGVAIVDFAWRVYPMGAGPAFHGVGSGVYVLRGEQWEEVLEHETVTRVDEPLGSGIR